jgi:tetratricopeptide (TPR) repeat protein
VILLLGEEMKSGEPDSMHPVLNTRVWLILSYAEQGRFKEAAEYSAEALRISELVGKEQEFLWSRLAISRLNVLRRDFATVIAMLEPILPRYRGEWEVYFPRAAASLGISYAESGRLDEGLALLQEADARARHMGFVFGHALTLSLLGEVLLRTGIDEEAWGTGTQAVHVARTSGEEGNEAWALHLLGAVAAHMGRQEVAAEHYMQALAIADRLGMNPLRARCLNGVSQVTG